MTNKRTVKYSNHTVLLSVKYKKKKIPLKDYMYWRQSFNKQQFNL